MIRSFLAQAAQSPGRQRAFRRAVVAHIVAVAVAVRLLPLSPRGGMTLTLLGQLLLIAGIVEGAVLVGWRLTQLPKSQALEFLLVSPVRPARLFISETLVGFLRLTLVTLSGLPVLALLAGQGVLDPIDLIALILVPLTWGAITGVILAAWAYESRSVRRWGERVMLGLVLLYRVVGVLAAEKLKSWLLNLPDPFGRGIYEAALAFHQYNPFGVMRHWTESGADLAWERAAGVEIGAIIGLLLLSWRAASRLMPDFHERHYQPAVARRGDETQKIADRPLAWWAVRRVSEYSGRINLWLAGGFALLYSAYSIAGDQWPPWMERTIFQLCDRSGGLGGLATALVVLAAVPAAFQYGLWDASAQDRCRRLELLLLTRLDGRDYWNAAAAAAWSRGRGYFAVAMLLWSAALISGKATVFDVAGAVAAGVLLWGLYFSLGFRQFARGVQGNGLGMLLTVGLPL